MKSSDILLLGGGLLAYQYLVKPGFEFKDSVERTIGGAATPVIQIMRDAGNVVNEVVEGVGSAPSAVVKAHVDAVNSIPSVQQSIYPISQIDSVNPENIGKAAVAAATLPLSIAKDFITLPFTASNVIMQSLGWS